MTGGCRSACSELMADGHAACCAGRAPRKADVDGGAAPSVRAAQGARSMSRWVRLEGGAFRMGSAEQGFAADGEGPVRTVRLSPFAIAAHTVTNTQFGDFVRETGYMTDAERFNWSFVFHAFVPPALKRRIVNVPCETPWWYPVPHAYWAQPEGPGSTVLDRLDHPVVHVSWNDAQAYCRWSGTRLPTRGRMGVRGPRRAGPESVYPWGDDLDAGRKTPLQHLAGPLPRPEHRRGRFRGDGAGGRLRAERLRALQRGRQCLGVVRGRLLARLSPRDIPHRPARRSNRAAVVRFAAAHSCATSPTATDTGWRREARTHRPARQATSASVSRRSSEISKLVWCVRSIRMSACGTSQT